MSDAILVLNAGSSSIKFLFFVVLPIGLVVWLFRRIFGRPRTI